MVTLTNTERRVLEALASGMSIEDAANHLGMSVDETRRHVRRICTIAGVRTPVEAVVWATHHGLF